MRWSLLWIMPHLHDRSLDLDKKLTKWCFRLRFCTCKAILGWGKPWQTRLTSVWIMPQVQVGSIARHADPQSGTLPLCYGCPRPGNLRCVGDLPVSHTGHKLHDVVMVVEDADEWMSHFLFCVHDLSQKIRWAGCHRLVQTEREREM